MFLPAGRHVLSLETRTEAGAPARLLSWTVTCSPGDLGILSTPAAQDGATAWTRLSAEFTVPANCPAQWLRLETPAGDRRAPTVVWFDRVAVKSFP